MGLRISASKPAVCTRVYLSSAWKNRTSLVGIIRSVVPTLACTQRRYSGGVVPALAGGCDRCASSPSIGSGFSRNRSRRRSQVSATRFGSTGFSR